MSFWVLYLRQYLRNLYHNNKKTPPFILKKMDGDIFLLGIKLNLMTLPNNIGLLFANVGYTIIYVLKLDNYNRSVKEFLESIYIS